MRVRVFPDETALGRAAAGHAAGAMREAIAQRGKTRILAGASPVLRGGFEALTRATDLAWGEVELFQDAEFVGLGPEHPGATRKFLWTHLLSRVRVGRYHLLDALSEPERVCGAEGEALRAAPIDLACVGLDAGGGLALNFPPADFASERPYLIVRLDETWRAGGAAERSFAAKAEAPERAITISLRQLLKAATLVVCASGAASAEAVKRAVEGAVSPLAPASLLQTHPAATLYLDRAAAAGLTRRPETEE